MSGVSVRQFGAKQQDLRGVVDPDEKHGEGCGRTINGYQRGMAQIKSNGYFAEGEEKRGEGGGRPHVAPFDRGIGNKFEDEREQKRNHEKGNHEIYGFQLKR